MSNEPSGTERVVIEPASATHVYALAQIHVRAWQNAYTGIVPQKVLGALSVEQRLRAFETGLSLRVGHSMSWLHEDIGELCSGHLSRITKEHGSTNRAGSGWMDARNVK